MMLIDDFVNKEIDKTGGFNLNETTVMMGFRKTLARITAVGSVGSQRTNVILPGTGMSEHDFNVKLKSFVKEHPIYNYNDIINSFSEEIVKTFEENGVKLLQTLGLPEEQTIDYRYWRSVNEFAGMCSTLVLHPHVWLNYLNMMEYTPSSDTLVTIQCGVRKPYTTNPNKNWILNGCYSYSQNEKSPYDVCFLSIVPILAYPKDYTVTYPFYFYEAGHFVSKAMEEFEEETSKIPLFVNMILKKGYKRVVFAHNGRWNRSLLPKITEIFRNTDIKIVNTCTPEFFENCVHELYPDSKSAYGLAASRLLGTNIYKDHFKSLFPELKDVNMRGTPEALKTANLNRVKQNKQFGIMNSNNKIEDVDNFF